MGFKGFRYGSSKYRFECWVDYLLQLATLHERKPDVVILAYTPAPLGVGDRRNAASFEASLVYIPNSQLARDT